MTRSTLGVLLALFVLASYGCENGAPRPARVAVEVVSEGLEFADEMLANRIDAVGPEMTELVRAEIAAGQILGETHEETYELAMVRWNELMEPTTGARHVLRAARAGALSLDHAIDAWQTQSVGSFGATAACALGILQGVVGALIEANIEVPQELTLAIQTLAPWATLVCPQPIRAGGAS